MSCHTVLSLKWDKYVVSHPIFRIVCHLERYEIKWKISCNSHYLLFVIDRFRFFYSFTPRLYFPAWKSWTFRFEKIKRTKSLFFLILPQFKNGRTLPCSLADRGSTGSPTTRSPYASAKARQAHRWFNYRFSLMALWFSQ